MMLDSMRSKLFSLPQLGVVAAVIALSACSSTGDKPAPTELKPLANTLNVKQAWTYSLAKGSADFNMAVNGGNELVAATIDGTVVRLDSATGKVNASYRHEHGITAGVDATTEIAAFVDAQNDLILLKREGAVAWRQKLPTQVLTSPLIAKGSVFVLGMDQTVRAFDVASGTSLWTSARTAPALLLRQASGMTIDGETLYAGLAQGKAASLSTTSGAVRWEQTLMSPRGGNEIEKLTDLVGKPKLVEGDLCVRSFQTGVACVAQQSGRSKWTKNLSGNLPIAADATQVIAIDRESLIQAYARDTGNSLFTVNALKHRDVSAAALLNRSFVLGDSQGFVHWLARDTGNFVARMSTDSTAINTAPVLAGQTVVVRTQNALYAYQTE